MRTGCVRPRCRPSLRGARASNPDCAGQLDCFAALAMTGASRTHCRFAPRAIRWQKYAQAKQGSRSRLHGRNHANSQAVPGVVGPFAGLDVPWLLRMRAESAPRPSVPDLGAVRCAGAELELRRISRARRRARGGACQARRQAGRICADPSRQLHRGAAGLVCLRRTRRHRGDHQHPLGAGRDGIFRRPLRRGRRDHPAGLCRDWSRPIAAICAGSR